MLIYAIAVLLVLNVLTHDAVVEQKSRLSLIRYWFIGSSILLSGCVRRVNIGYGEARYGGNRRSPMPLG
ncbi:hypothetical protein ANCCAN_24599 [Ancylostoma caninum]|uniref:Uncharacterized protein n=1 Tax=Ancylostoma caninum TaxID=29170 RepID=A0A368FDF9_ANCCA|nr:hypothetical protein ANCCAN_24599 [Ancylostoma caninum]